MCTDYTHAVVGLGLARLYAGRPMPWAYWALAAILPIVPDLDVFATAHYGAPLGHRGATHSLVFALVLGGIAAGIVFRYFRASYWSLAVLLVLIIASHGLLDSLTTAGEGVAFFWPMGGRYGNWGPLPVSDIALDLPDPRYSRTIRSELLWVWLPLGLVLGLCMVWRYRRRRSAC